MTEEWRDIPGYEGAYQVSDLGRVRSVERRVRAVSKAGREYQRLISGCVLTPGRSRGYLIVNLSPGGTVAVQILVATAFLPRPSALHEVNHRDGNKHNNALSNLEWLTKGENMLHAVSAGLNTQALPVTDGVRRWPSQSQAAFDITGDRRRGSEIARHLRDERATALGRKWRLCA